MELNGAKVKAAREDKKVTVTALAAAIDMSAPWVYALEKSPVPMKVKEPVVKAMARFLGVKKEELL